MQAYLLSGRDNICIATLFLIETLRMGIIIEHPLLGSTIETLIDVICIIGFILFVGAFVVLPVRLHHSFSAKSVMNLINSVSMYVDTLHMSISTT